jgi:hypothetical protein
MAGALGQANAPNFRAATKIVAEINLRGWHRRWEYGVEKSG